MNISPIDTRIRNNSNIKFKAYTFYPQRKISLSDINPIKRQVDKIIGLSLEFANRRITPLSQELSAITKTVPITNKQGKTISYGYDINPDGRKKYLLFLHGTGQNISNFQNFYNTIIQNTKYAIFAPEFRGMAKNPPAPISRKKFLEDAIFATDALQKKEIPLRDIVVSGHSLGAHIAADLVTSKKGFKELILISPINSFSDNMHPEKALKGRVHPLIIKLYNVLPILNRPFEEFYAVKKIIPKIKTNISIIHSKNDNLVDVSSAIEISKNCKNLRQLIITEKGDHKIEKLKTEALQNILI